MAASTSGSDNFLNTLQDVRRELMVALRSRLRSDRAPSPRW